MLDKLLGNIFDKEKMVKDMIQSTLENVAEELGCKHDEFFIMIKPTKEDFDFKCHIYKGTPPVHVRQITIKEILGEDEESGG